MNSELFFYECSSYDYGEPNTKNYELQLRIPFRWLLNNQTNREMSTKQSNFEELSNFMLQVKIKFSGFNNDFIEIFYLSREAVFMESLKFSSGCRSIERVQKVSNWLDKNTWYPITVLRKSSLVKDSYTFFFDLCVKENRTVQFYQSILVPESENSFVARSSIKFNASTAKLLMNTAFSDVTVKSDIADEFPAHKMILASSSNVLKAHFEHNTEENISNIVKMAFSTDVVKGLLHYMYTGYATNIENIAVDLLKAADFYELSDLKILCQLSLQDKLTLENAIEMLILSDMYKAKYLKQKTLEFICDGDQSRDFIHTKDWKTIQSPELLKTLFEYIVMNK